MCNQYWCLLPKHLRHPKGESAPTMQMFPVTLVSQPPATTQGRPCPYGSASSAHFGRCEQGFKGRFGRAFEHQVLVLLGGEPRTEIAGAHETSPVTLWGTASVSLAAPFCLPLQCPRVPSARSSSNTCSSVTAVLVDAHSLACLRHLVVCSGERWLQVVSVHSAGRWSSCPVMGWKQHTWPPLVPALLGDTLVSMTK